MKISGEQLKLAVGIILNITGMLVLCLLYPYLLNESTLATPQRRCAETLISCDDLANYLILGALLFVLGGTLILSRRRSMSCENGFSPKSLKISPSISTSHLKICLQFALCFATGLIPVFLADHVRSFFLPPIFWVLGILACCLSFCLGTNTEKRPDRSFQLPIEWLILIGVFVASIAWYSISLGDFAYSLRGIESGFYVSSSGLLYGDNRLFCQASSRQFWSAGTFCAHPAGTSFYQAAVMALLGDSLFAFRISTVVFSLAGLFPLYFLMKQTQSIKAGIIATTVYIFSFYHHQWAHMGYNNLYFITPLLFSLAFATHGIKFKKRLSLFLSGLFAVIGFYFNYMSFLTPPILLLYLSASVRCNSDGQFDQNKPIAPFIPFILGILAGGLPFLLHLKEVNLAVHLPSLGDSSALLSGMQFSETLNLSSLRIFFLTWIRPFSPFDAPLYYIEGNLFDRLSLLLSLWGLSHCIVNWKRNAFSLTLLISLSLYLIAMGCFNKYEHFAVTRLLFFIPFLSILAGIGFSQLCVISTKHLQVAALIIAVLFISISSVVQVQEYKNKWNNEASWPLSQYIWKELAISEDNIILLAEKRSIASRNIKFISEFFWLPPSRLFIVKSENNSFEVLHKRVKEYDPTYTLVEPSVDITKLDWPWRICREDKLAMRGLGPVRRFWHQCF